MRPAGRDQADRWRALGSGDRWTERSHLRAHSRTARPALRSHRGLSVGLPGLIAAGRVPRAHRDRLAPAHRAAPHGAGATRLTPAQGAAKDPTRRGGDGARDGEHHARRRGGSHAFSRAQIPSQRRRPLYRHRLHGQRARPGVGLCKHGHLQAAAAREGSSRPLAKPRPAAA